MSFLERKSKVAYYVMAFSIVMTLTYSAAVTLLGNPLTPENVLVILILIIISYMMADTSLTARDKKKVYEMIQKK